MLPSGTGRRRGLAEARRGAAEREREREGRAPQRSRGKAALWWRETWPRRRGKPRPGRWHGWPRRVLRVLSRLDAAPRTVSAAPATLAGKGRVAQLRLAGPADRPCSLPAASCAQVVHFSRACARPQNIANTGFGSVCGPQAFAGGSGPPPPLFSGYKAN